MPDDPLAAVLEIVTTLARKTAKGGYIFRGEPKRYDQVTSRLYRDYAATGIPEVERLQRQILEDVRDYTDDEDDKIILSELQHFGGSTNLIDFTTDYLVALFFACDGLPDEDGRVVLLETSGEIAEYVWAPRSPVNRTIAQKSVFVEHPLGVVRPDDEVIVPRNLKLPILDYLHNCHDLDAISIYNDLHGFIRYRALHHEALVNFATGLTCEQSGDYQGAVDYYTKSLDRNPRSAIAHNNRGVAYHKKGDHHQAIQDFTSAINLNPDFSYAYCNRGEAWLHLSEWEQARADLTTARDLGYDIVASFRVDYANTAAFEQQHGVQMPLDIAEMLGG